jgi:RNAse (barnase) inhibitor barstar
MNNFSFIQSLSEYTDENGFVAILEAGLRTQHDLFKEISQKLNFPSYFGYNMDALSDCLRDLSWICNYKVVIVHSDVPNIEVHELRTYLEVLDDAVSDWNGDETHSLEIFFPVHAASYLHMLRANQSQ